MTSADWETEIGMEGQHDFFSLPVLFINISLKKKNNKNTTASVSLPEAITQTYKSSFLKEVMWHKCKANA